MTNKVRHHLPREAYVRGLGDEVDRWLNKRMRRESKVKCKHVSPMTKEAKKAMESKPCKMCLEDHSRNKKAS